MFRISLLTVAFVANVFSEPIQHCDYDTSVDISQGTNTSNGDIDFNGERYQQHEYFFDEKSRTRRGCICGKKICIRKCCPLGQGYVNKTRCADVSSPFDPPIWDDYGELKGINVSRFHLLFGKVECTNTFRAKVSQISKNLHLLEDGKLFVNLSNAPTPWMKSDPDQYCIDTFITPGLDPKTKKNVTMLDALVCFDNKHDKPNYASSYVGMLISCVFFIVTIAVYAWLPELQNLHGRVLMVYLACMCVGFAFLSTMQIMLTVDNITANACLGLSFVIYFALLSGFFWLNVMCFDIWWTFSGKRGLSLEKWSMRARFCAYAAYAFGFPTGLTVLLAGLEFSGLPPHPLLPMLKDQACFLTGTSKFIYLYVPIAILCIANLLFFILTAWKINQIKKLTQKTLKSKDSYSTDQQRTDRERFLLYAKLFTVMGVNWILEVVSAIYPQADQVWRFTDAFNMLTGVFIFVIFVCKKKILRLMQKRFNEMFQISQSGSGDLRPIGNRDVQNWNEYQQQEGSLGCDSDNSRTTKTTKV